ncbi:MAG: hypothetical protein M2R46_04244 [Verrucomicrobia subdivision 3 bacterium]|nr:hypothetical protein [Limisphaerales bacterium]
MNKIRFILLALINAGKQTAKVLPALTTGNLNGSLAADVRRGACGASTKSTQAPL